VAESRPRRGHGEDSIYYDQANHNWAAAVSLGYKGGKRACGKVTGRTKTEVKAKLRDLRRDLDNNVRSSATYTVGAAPMTGWPAASGPAITVSDGIAEILKEAFSV
jgi:hypothetical protein